MPSDRKTEPPSPRRLRKARQDGDHPTSRALIGLGALAGALLTAPLALDAARQSVLDALHAALSPAGVPDARRLALDVGSLVVPLLGAAALGALISGVSQTRAVLSTKPLTWDLARLNPFARSASAWVTRSVSLSIALGAAIGTTIAAWLVLRDDGAAIAASIGDARSALWLATRACQSLGWWAFLVCLAAAIVDSVYRHAAWHRRHRMTRDEVRQERRENDGDPELRLARQRIHRELAGGATDADLARASLLVLGVPPLAIALIYDPQRDHAPRVMLRGTGARAARLWLLAASHGVPVEHDTALALALASVPLDQEIPKQCYADVAEALRRTGLFQPKPPAR